MALISGSPGARGGAYAQEHLRPVLSLLRTKLLEERRVTIPGLPQKVQDDRLADAPTRELIRAQIAALAALAAPQHEG